MLAQVDDLVHNERDERRNNERAAGDEESRELVGERLAAAGGHDAHDVASIHDRVDYSANIDEWVVCYGSKWGTLVGTVERTGC